MELFNTLFLFFVGFFILIKGANYLVSGSRSLAAILSISPWFVGLVIVSMGTSIPEFAINIAAAFNGGTIGLETIVGSNIFNILVILGLSALISPIVFRPFWIQRDLVLSILAIAVASVAILFPVFGDAELLGVTRLEGLALSALLLLWIIYIFRKHDGEGDQSVDYQVFSGFVSFLLIMIGILGVFFGGRWVVDGAKAIALLGGVSPELVALTVVAIGTSLPELVVSFVAFAKKQGGIAVGNIIGSSIFNFLGIVGITAFIHPINVGEMVRFDILAVLGVALLLFVATFVIGKRYTLSRLWGAFFLLMYALYIVFIFWRG